MKNLNEKLMLAQLALNHYDFGPDIDTNGFYEGWDISDDRALTAIVDLCHEHHPEVRATSFKAKVVICFDADDRITEVKAWAGQPEPGQTHANLEEWGMPAGLADMSWYDPESGGLRDDPDILPPHWHERWRLMDRDFAWPYLFHGALTDTLPPDFDRWAEEGPTETTIAHVAAEHGSLPRGFDMERWGGLRDGTDRTVRSIAAERTRMKKASAASDDLNQFETATEQNQRFASGPGA